MALSRKPEDEYWGEEAGRRFVVQQEELVALRDENERLRHQLDAGEQRRTGCGCSVEFDGKGMKSSCLWPQGKPVGYALLLCASAALC